jgi:hypothetical protein
MSIKNRFQPVQLVSLGVLFAVMPLLMRDNIKIPDFFRGLMMGLGIGLEIIGLILIARQKKFRRYCRRSQQTTEDSVS